MLEESVPKFEGKIFWTDRRAYVVNIMMGPRTPSLWLNEKGLPIRTSYTSPYPYRQGSQEPSDEDRTLETKCSLDTTPTSPEVINVGLCELRPGNLEEPVWKGIIVYTPTF